MVEQGGLERLLKSPITFLALTLSFLTTGVIVNLIQLVLYLTVRPLDRRLFHTLNYYPRYWFISHLVFVAEWWGGMEVYIHTSKDNMDRYLGRENTLCVLNHSYEIDWLAAFTLCDRLHMLGHCRAFAKKSLQYIPILGTSLRMGGDVFLDRNWEKDRDVIGRQVTELVQYPSAMWLMVTAEGTRFTLAKHEASRKFAREKGLPELQHHLTPRTKGFTHTLPYLRGKIVAVYDMQMAFTRGSEPTMVGLLKGERYEVHVYVNRIPISTLPEGEEELAKWLHQLYQKKDRMMDSFLNTSDFFTESGVRAEPVHRVERRWTSLLNVVTWAAITLGPIVTYLANMLMSGSLLAIFLVVATMALGAVIVLSMIRMTMINKGSAYGAQDKKSTGHRARNTDIQPH